jgi:hypothetical protein
VVGRVVVAVVAALAVGAGAGWAVGHAQEEPTPAPTEPVSATVAPLPATPSLPVEILQPDPDDETLATGIALRPVELTVKGTDGDPTAVLRLPIPVGWAQRFDGVAKWGYTVPGNSDQSFGLRVQVLAGTGESVATAIRSRQAALESAEAQGNLDDVEIADENSQGFDATYVDGGFKRLSFERFYAGEDGTVFATVVGFGREQDRAGLIDLLALITRDLRTETPEPDDGEGG